MPASPRPGRDRSALWLLGFPHWPRLQLSKHYGPRHRVAPGLGQPQVGRRLDHGTSRPHDPGAEPRWGCHAIVGARLRGTLEAAEPWDRGASTSAPPPTKAASTPWAKTQVTSMSSPTTGTGHTVSTGTFPHKNSTSRPQQVTGSPKFIEAEKVKRNEKAEDLLSIERVREKP